MRSRHTLRNIRLKLSFSAAKKDDAGMLESVMADLTNKELDTLFSAYDKDRRNLFHVAAANCNVDAFMYMTTVLLEHDMAPAIYFNAVDCDGLTVLDAIDEDTIREIDPDKLKKNEDITARVRSP